jgi:hypothetical protein
MQYDTLQAGSSAAGEEIRQVLTMIQPREFEQPDQFLPHTDFLHRAVLNLPDKEMAERKGLVVKQAALEPGPALWNSMVAAPYVRVPNYRLRIDLVR